MAIVNPIFFLKKRKQLYLSILQYVHRPVLRRLCGWETLGEVPSESTFSRAFGAFAKDNRPQQIHEAMIKAHYGEKIAGHISRDGTAIHAREKARNKPVKQPKNQENAAAAAKTNRRRHRNRPGCKEPTRLQRQLDRDLTANLADLPTVCDWGCKKNSQGKKEIRKKGHLSSTPFSLPYKTPADGRRRRTSAGVLQKPLIDKKSLFQAARSRAR